MSIAADHGKDEGTGTYKELKDTVVFSVYPVVEVGALPFDTYTLESFPRLSEYIELSYEIGVGVRDGPCLRCGQRWKPTAD